MGRIILLFCAFVFLVLCFAFVVSRIVCSEEKSGKLLEKEEIVKMVKEIIDSPQEYDIPKETLDRLLLRDTAMKNANAQVKIGESEFSLARARLTLMQLEAQRVREAFSAELRLFLTSLDVPYDDLPNWNVQNNRAIRETKKEKK